MRWPQRRHRSRCARLGGGSPPTKKPQSCSKWRSAARMARSARCCGAKVFSSQLTMWHKQYQAGERRALSQRRGPTAARTGDMVTVARLARENTQIRDKLARAELVIALQKSRQRCWITRCATRAPRPRDRAVPNAWRWWDSHGWARRSASCARRPCGGVGRRSTACGNGGPARRAPCRRRW